MPLVAGIFDHKTLEEFKEKAGKGLWKGRNGCGEYFQEEKLKEYLTKQLKSANSVAPVSNEMLLAARMVLFKTMSEGILERDHLSEALACAAAFGNAYPALTKKIAEEYPAYFIDPAIAELCITDAPALLHQVKGELDPRTDVSLVAGKLSNQTLADLKDQASKGNWKSLLPKIFSKGDMDCGEYFAREYLVKLLKETNVEVNYKTIRAARMVLFNAMNQGINIGIQAAREVKKDPSKVLLCAEKFTEAYPELTIQIAQEYPKYFVNQEIASCCINAETLHIHAREADSLLNKVKDKL